MLRFLLAFTIVAMSLLSESWADTVPNAEACVARKMGAQQEVHVRQHVGDSGFAAFATYDADGWPAITYAPLYFTLPPTVQHFLSLHECGHLVLQTTNEFLANCWAIAQGHWSEADLEMIAISHLSIGRLPPQYGGSGAAFWAGTKRTCPQYFSTEGPVASVQLAEPH